MTEAARPSRRQHQRYNVDVQVAVSVDNEKLDARTRDMSRAGLCLVATQPIARETEVSLELVLTFGDDGVSEPLQIDRAGRLVHGPFRGLSDRGQVREGG